MLIEPGPREMSAAVYPTTEIGSIRILDIELSEALPVLLARDEKSRRCYQQAQCLVRLHHCPLGLVTFPFTTDELAPPDYLPLLWEALHHQINEHLRQDDLEPIRELNASGIQYTQLLPCSQEREAALANAPFASVIVSTHERTDQLARCLPALLALRYPHYEIIIVDNAPITNATAELVQQTYRHIAHLRYVREDIPGLSVGLNRGLSEARGEILAFTDDDVLVDPYWLLHLTSAFRLANDVKCVTGLVLPQELETPAQIWFEEFGGFSKGFSRRIYDMTEHRPAEPLYPYTAGRFGTGANMAFRPDFLKSVGGFDSALHTGMDIAAFFQVVRQGHTLVYEPAAIVRHLHRRSYPELEKQLYSYGVAATAYLTKSIFDRPWLLFEILLKVPYGIFFTLGPKSSKNKKKSPNYPKKLTKVERKGLLAGPFIYMSKRRKRIPLSAHASEPAGKSTRQ